MDKGVAIALVSLSLGLLGFLFTHFKSKTVSEIEKKLGQCEERIKSRALASDVEVLKKQMDLFWTMAEKGLGTFLHSPHRAQLDRLIEKVDGGGRLNPDELVEFDVLTAELIRDDPSLTADEKTALIIYRAAVVSRHRARMKPLNH